MEANYRRRIVAISTFLGGLYFVFEFLAPESKLKDWGIADRHEAITLGFLAIGLVTIALGIINLVMIHGSRIAFKRKGWINSVALLVGLTAMIVCSGFDWMLDAREEKVAQDATLLAEFSRHIMQSETAEKKPEGLPDFDTRISFLVKEANQTLERNQQEYINPGTGEAEKELAQLTRQNILKNLSALEPSVRKLESVNDRDQKLAALKEISTASSELSFLKRQYLKALTESSNGRLAYKFLYDGLFVSLGSAMFSLLGVYIAAAAYRAFRIRTIESSLMMTAALIVMLGQTPFGIRMYEDLPAIRSWLLEVPNSGVTRAIGIGALVAGLVLAFRMWFSIESDKFSQDGKK